MALLGGHGGAKGNGFRLAGEMIGAFALTEPVLEVLFSLQPSSPSFTATRSEQRRGMDNLCTRGRIFRIREMSTFRSTHRPGTRAEVEPIHDDGIPPAGLAQLTFNDVNAIPNIVANPDCLIGRPVDSTGGSAPPARDWGRRGCFEESIARGGARLINGR
jgi:hypothetical protein